MAAKKLQITKLAQRFVFDQLGDRVGKVRDFVVLQRLSDPPQIIGLEVYIPGRRLVFISIGRVTSISEEQIITTGKVNLTRFQKRSGEQLAREDLIGQKVTTKQGAGVIEDFILEQTPLKEWQLATVLCRLNKSESSLFNRGQLVELPWSELVTAQEDADPIRKLALSMSELHPADLASELLVLPPQQLIAVVEELTVDRLADALEEMAESDQVKILGRLENDRAASVLDEMQPDDAADLIAELPEGRGEQLLELMEPEEAEDIRMLLNYGRNTAGGLMTSDPIILSASTTVAEGLAHIRRAELAPALAAMVCITLPPLETPSGRFLGVVSFQRMLRHPPGEKLGTLLDTSVQPVSVDTPADE
ncbi:MAG: magnesium transporter, partial [Microbacteriaceae bacterium]